MLSHNINCIICFLFFSFSTLGQQILPVPDKYINKIYIDRDIEPLHYEKFIIERGKVKNKSNWFIVCDRPNSPVYENPDDNSEVQRFLNFQEYAYVIKEKGEWLKVIKGRVTKGKIKKGLWEGWIHKSNVLISSYALSSEGNHNFKMLAKISPFIKNIISEDGVHGVKKYEGPESHKSIGTVSKNSLLYVYKIEGERVLVGKDYLFRYSNTQNLIGWVNLSEIITFTNRIFLEPNYDVIAFGERSKKLQHSIFGFKTINEANTYSKFGRLVEQNILLNFDPTYLPEKYLSSNNNKRIHPDIFRFPLLTLRENSFRTVYWFNAKNTTDGDFIVGAEFPNGINNFLNNLKEKDKDDSNEAKLVSRYRKYAIEVFFPFSLSSTKYSLFKASYLFTENELLDYILFLESILLSRDLPSSQKRADLFFKLYAKYNKSNTLNISRKEFSKLDLNSFRTICHAGMLTKRNPFLEENAINFIMEDLRNSEKISTNSIEEIYRHLERVRTGLLDIMNVKNENPYSFTSYHVNRYFWLGNFHLL